MQTGANRTKTKIPKKYSRPLSRGHHEHRVRMTLSVSIKFVPYTHGVLLMKAVNIFWVF